MTADPPLATVRDLAVRRGWSDADARTATAALELAGMSPPVAADALLRFLQTADHPALRVAVLDDREGLRPLSEVGPALRAELAVLNADEFWKLPARVVAVALVLASRGS